jgi:hypothetical protein
MRRSSWAIASLVATWFLASDAHAQRLNSEQPGWQIEQGVAEPSYAFIEPTGSNLNIDVIVLACEQAGTRKVLQLQVYLSDEERLRLRGAMPAEVADDPRARISIDNAEYPVEIMFAGDHVLLADSAQGRVPRLSDRLIDAIQIGQSMLLEFALLPATVDRGGAFDGNATVDLQAAGARRAFAVMRQCASRPTSTAGH